MVCGKEECPRETNLKEIYTENTVGTTARSSFIERRYTVLSVVGFCVVFAYT
jgi:hypothetical protein